MARSSAVTQKLSPLCGGFQFFRDSGRIHHKAPLLGAGFLQRSCWMLHTHPPIHPQVDPNPVKVLLPMGDEEKKAEL